MKAKDKITVVVYDKEKCWLNDTHQCRSWDEVVWNWINFYRVWRVKVRHEPAGVEVTVYRKDPVRAAAKETV